MFLLAFGPRRSDYRPHPSSSTATKHIDAAGVYCMISFTLWGFVEASRSLTSFRGRHQAHTYIWHAYGLSFDDLLLTVPSPVRRVCVAAISQGTMIRRAIAQAARAGTSFAAFSYVAPAATSSRLTFAGELGSLRCISSGCESMPLQVGCETLSGMWNQIISRSSIHPDIDTCTPALQFGFRRSCRSSGVSVVSRDDPGSKARGES